MYNIRFYLSNKHNDICLRVWNVAFECVLKLPFATILPMNLNVKIFLLDGWMNGKSNGAAIDDYRFVGKMLHQQAFIIRNISQQHNKIQNNLDAELKEKKKTK